MKQYFYMAGMALLIASCGTNTNQQPAVPVDQTANGYTVQVYQDSSLGFGFNISQSGKKIIDQPIIPAIAQNKSFASRQDATQVSQLVKRKLDSGIFPPAITVAELDSMHIRY